MFNVVDKILSSRAGVVMFVAYLVPVWILLIVSAARGGDVPIFDVSYEDLHSWFPPYVGIPTFVLYCATSLHAYWLRRRRWAFAVWVFYPLAFVYAVWNAFRHSDKEDEPERRRGSFLIATAALLVCVAVCALLHAVMGRYGAS